MKENSKSNEALKLETDTKPNKKIANGQNKTIGIVEIPKSLQSLKNTKTFLLTSKDNFKRNFVSHTKIPKNIETKTIDHQSRQTRENSLVQKKDKRPLSFLRNKHIDNLDDIRNGQNLRNVIAMEKKNYVVQKNAKCDIKNNFMSLLYNKKCFDQEKEDSKSINSSRSNHHKTKATRKNLLEKEQKNKKTDSYIQILFEDNVDSNNLDLNLDLNLGSKQLRSYSLYNKNSHSMDDSSADEILDSYNKCRNLKETRSIKIIPQRQNLQSNIHKKNQKSINTFEMKNNVFVPLDKNPESKQDSLDENNITIETKNINRRWDSSEISEKL